MNYIDKIGDLISEANKYTFDNNNYRVSHGTYGRASIEMRAWVAECEDFILTNYGEESVPWRVFQKLAIDHIEGNYEDVFEQQKAIIVSALSSCLRIPPRLQAGETTVAKMKTNFSQVFMVHGHEENVKVRVARFIERLGFEPIILHEQASGGNTIIEKIEAYTNVGFGIVLYTGCDVGGKLSETPTLKLRARQNVVFEHGYLIGKIGRNNVCALVKGALETPNDISGVVYIQFDESDAWQIQVAKELKRSGYGVDMNRII